MIFNPLIKAILRSPLHPVMSANTMLVEYTGRRSGKTFQVPVNYLDLGGNLVTTSLPGRTWWRSLQGGAPVNLLLAGKNRKARGLVVESSEEAERLLAQMITRQPQYARYLGVAMNADRQPQPEDVHRVAASRVIIRFELEE